MENNNNNNNNKNTSAPTKRTYMSDDVDANGHRRQLKHKHQKLHKQQRYLQQTRECLRLAL